MNWHDLLPKVWGASACCALASAAAAVPVELSWFDTPFCDVLSLPPSMHELGNPPGFPKDELISSFDTMKKFPACAPTDNPLIPNVLVSMTNLTATFWMDVHYVADPETFISNDDGMVNGEFAFRIDTIGINTPLVFESITFDGIFEPSETWNFIIQDYINGPGLPPSLFGSVGAVGGMSGGDLLSSGSIIAREVPGPAGAVLIAIAMASMPRSRLRR
jgi:hypothetical protein